MFGWQVIVFDHDHDAKLCEMDERAADAMAEAVSQGPQACVQVGTLLLVALSPSPLVHLLLQHQPPCIQLCKKSGRSQPV